jgi:hypothetical protein
MGLTDLSIILDLKAEEAGSVLVVSTGCRIAAPSLFGHSSKVLEHIRIAQKDFNSFSENRIIHFIGFKSFFSEKEYAYSRIISPENRLLIHEKIKRINEKNIYNNTMKVINGKLSEKKRNNLEHYLTQISQVEKEGFSALIKKMARLKYEPHEKLIEEIFNYYNKNYSFDSLKESLITLFRMILPLYENGSIGSIKMDKTLTHFNKRFTRLTNYFEDAEWKFKRDFIVLDYIYQLLSEYRRVIRLDQMQSILLKEKKERQKRSNSLIKLIETNQPIVNITDLSTQKKIYYIKEALKELEKVQNQLDYMNHIYFDKLSSHGLLGRPKLVNEFSFILQCYNFAISSKAIKNAKKWTSSLLNLVITINNDLNKGLGVDEMYYYRSEDNVKDVVKAAKKRAKGSKNEILQNIFNQNITKLP